MQRIFDNLDMVIALILVVGALVLITSGIDHEVKSILTVAAGWTFGRGFGEKIRRRPPPK